VVAFALLDEFHLADSVAWLSGHLSEESLVTLGYSDDFDLLLVASLLDGNSELLLETGDGEFALSWDLADVSSESLGELGASSESEDNSLALSSDGAVGVSLRLSADCSASEELSDNLSAD